MICFASNATGWDVDTQALVPGGQVDRLITPITDHLPRGSWTVARQPLAGAINVYLSNRERYLAGSRRFDRFGVSYAHGIADKGYRRGETSRNRRFDWITVPGPAHARGLRADRVPPARIITVGYPKLDPLFDAPRVPRAKDGPLRVLYAPTHGGGSERHVNGNPRAPGAGATSWWHRDEILALLDVDGIEVTLAPHPRHHPQRRATFSEYLSADVAVVDGGSTIYEALALGIPVVLTTWLTAHRNLTRMGGQLIEARVYRDRIGYHVDRPEDLVEAVAKAAVGGVKPKDRALIDDVLPPKLRGRSGQRFAEWLLSLEAR